MSEETKKETPVPQEEERHTHKVGLIEVNEVSTKAKKSLLLRTIYAVAMIAVLLPALIFGGWVWFAFISLVFIGATHEILCAVQKKIPWYLAIVCYVFMAGIVYWAIAKDNVDAFFAARLSGEHFMPDLARHTNSLYVSPIWMAIMIAVFFFLSIALKNFTFSDITYIFLMLWMVGLGLQAALYLRYVPFIQGARPIGDSGFFDYWQSIELIVFLAVTIYMNDTFAYLGGMLFGKHKMAPRVSPKKTWEGFFSGWIFGAAFGAAFGLICSHLGSPMLAGVFDMEHWYMIVIAAILLPLYGVLGDLSFSMVKRHFNFKDYSHLLGPHGGILDRIDSALFGLLGLATVVMTFLYFSGLIH